MYVKTTNGKDVNVRSEPFKGDNVIGTVPYGGQVVVDWSYAGNDGWTKVVWGSMGDGYIMSRFLVDSAPGPVVTPYPIDNESKEVDPEKKKLEKELKSEVAFADYFYIAVRAPRASGWANFRTGPSKTTKRVSSFSDGKELLAIGETTNWYRAIDQATGKVGYIHKTYTVRLAKQYVSEKETSNGVQALGTLNVNGEFNLTCVLPEGYNLQVINVRGNQIIASVLSDDMTRPQMYLSIAYDESYGDVEKLNNLSEADLAILEETFKDMNDVNISYRETTHGTRLMVARETGADTDFVDILTIYKGYFIEFNMAPNPQAADQTLTDDQIQMCVNFLSDLDFVAAT